MFLEKLRNSLAKTKEVFSSGISNMLTGFVKVDENLLSELEEILIMADVGVSTTEIIIDRLRDKIKKDKIDCTENIKSALKDVLTEVLEKTSENKKEDSNVVMVVGVNGVGKTTTLGKLSHFLVNKGKKVVVCAADTFRAAAVEQLEIWCERSQVKLVKKDFGTDPAAVVFDAIKVAEQERADILICDTAGRLHNKKNLMDELGKINRTIDKSMPDARKEILLVLDATTGQNGIIQAKAFAEVTGVTGIVVTKLDGTAKGGMIFAVTMELGIPIKYIGIGEGIDDFEEFNARDFVECMF